MIHPLNIFEGKPATTIATTDGPLKISDRRFTISSSYRGIFSKHIGKPMRLVSLTKDKEPGEYLNDVATLCLEEDFIGKVFPAEETMGIEFRYLEPIPR